MATPYWNANNNTGKPPVVVQGQVVQGQVVQPQGNSYGGYFGVVGGGGAGNANAPPQSMMHQANAYDNMDNQQVPAHGTSEWTKGEHQPKRFRDLIWGILFYIHLGVMAFLAISYMPQMASVVDYGNNNNNGGGRQLMKLRFLAEEEADVVVDVNGILWIVCVSGVFALILSTLALGFMISFSEILVKSALLFNVILTGLFSIAAFLTGNMFGGIIALFMFAVMAYYTYAVWTRIPFAASNLITASTAVKSNLGLSFYAYLSLFLSFGWSVWWTVSSVSTAFVVHGCDADGECQKQISTAFIFVFALSYYWTIQVIANVVHVTVAGTVATWWFAPLEANGCCSKAVRESYTRSMTYSFGSICLGSLIVAIIQAIREVVHQARESDDNLLICLAECLIACVESLVEYFNKWAFVFVGIYGYGFMEAGINVMALFRSRGWTTIITDDLVDKTLLMVSVGVGILNGLFAALLSVYIDTLGAGLPFLVGFVLGLALSSILFNVVGSGVATVIVCYAEAPAEFQANHPQLSQNMRAAWQQAWPTDFQY